MKSTQLLFLFLFITGSKLYAQCKVTEFSGSMQELCADSKKWKCKEFEDSIVLTYSDKFTINTLLGPRNITDNELNKPDSNTLLITFKCYPNWSDSVYNHVKTQNALIKQSYINHYEKIGWPTRTSKTIFLENPLKFLNQHDYKIDETGILITRLPDFRIGNCGVFMKLVLIFPIYTLYNHTLGKKLNTLSCKWQHWIGMLIARLI
jgi:hypothetical protein